MTLCISASLEGQKQQLKSESSRQVDQKLIYVKDRKLKYLSCFLIFEVYTRFKKKEEEPLIASNPTSLVLG